MSARAREFVVSGGPEAGATLYCLPTFCHPFTGFRIVLVVLHA